MLLQERGITTNICDNTTDNTIANLLDAQVNQFDYGTTRCVFYFDKREYTLTVTLSINHNYVFCSVTHP
jgi:hypothetical protein